MTVEPRLIKTFEDAELAARDWMRFMGFLDAQIFPGGGADGGVDVTSLEAVAQVKATVGKVGRPVIQQISGIARLEGKRALCFAIGGFTPDASHWAVQADVALYEFDLIGTAHPVNAYARDLLAAATGHAITWDDVESRLESLAVGEEIRALPHRWEDPASWTITRAADGFAINADACVEHEKIRELRREVVLLDSRVLLDALLHGPNDKRRRAEANAETKARLEARIRDLESRDPFPHLDTNSKTPDQAVVAVRSALRQGGYDLGDFRVSPLADEQLTIPDASDP